MSTQPAKPVLPPAVQQEWRGETYHGRPVTKASSFDWKVSFYIVTVGIAGAAQMIAAVARTRPDSDALVRNARFLALAVVPVTTGALAGFAGFQPPGVEPAIAASIVVLGLLISWRKGFPLGGVVSLVGVFAFFHGVAHGSELAGGAQLAALAGMVLSTAGLHLAGVGLGRLALTHRQRVRQAVGAALTMLGTWLLMQAA